MSLVTSCPQCATIFVVRPEQLAAQKGKVRCGNCQQVFNALDSLQEPVNTAAPAETDEPMVDATTLAETFVDHVVEIEELPVSVEQTEQAPEATAIKAPAELPPKLNKVISELLVPIDLSADAASSESLPREVLDREALHRETLPSPLSDVEIEGKLQQVRRRKVNRISLVLLCVILVLIAALQTVYFMRTSITSQWPVLKPDFTAACKFLGCTIELATNADLLTVDDSDLHEDTERPGLIRLSTTLINNAAFRQRYPLLELTLTDANESPVLRRTFKPSDYLPATADMGNGLASGEEVQINLALTSEEKTVSGYRVYVTY